MTLTSPDTTDRRATTTFFKKALPLLLSPRNLQNLRNLRFFTLSPWDASRARGAGARDYGAARGGSERDAGGACLANARLNDDALMPVL